jgi:hypothetical protein
LKVGGRCFLQSRSMIPTAFIQETRACSSDGDSFVQGE